MPPAPPPARQTAPFSVERLAEAPKLDGEIGWEEWPRTMLQLDREKSRWSASGAPVFAKVGYDDRYLYVAVNVAVFRAEDQVLRVLEGTLGESWKVDQAATLQFK
jgi:hypothetical protein